MATDFINRETVLQIIRNYDFKSSEYLDGWAKRLRNAIQADLTDYVNAVPPADVRPVKIGHYVTDDMGDSSCSECGEKYLDITKRFCPECGAKLRRNDGDQ